MGEIEMERENKLEVDYPSINKNLRRGGVGFYEHNYLCKDPYHSYPKALHKKLQKVLTRKDWKYLGVIPLTILFTYSPNNSQQLNYLDNYISKYKKRNKEREIHSPYILMVGEFIFRAIFNYLEDEDILNFGMGSRFGFCIIQGFLHARYIFTYDQYPSTTCNSLTALLSSIHLAKGNKICQIHKHFVFCLNNGILKGIENNLERIQELAKNLFGIDKDATNKSIKNFVSKYINKEIKMGEENTTTGIIIGARNNYLDIVQYLIKHGGKVDAKREYRGFNCMEFAVRNQNVIMILLLIANVKDKYSLVVGENGQNCNKLFMSAAYLNDLNLISTLFNIYEDIKYDFQFNQLFGPFLFAVTKNSHSIIHSFLQRGNIDINALNTNNMNALMYSIKLNHRKVFEKLSTYETLNINQLTAKKKSALYYAIKYRRCELFNKLLLFKPKWKTITVHRGDSLLHLALKYFHEDIINVVIFHSPFSSFMKINIDGLLPKHLLLNIRSDSIKNFFRKQATLVETTLMKKKFEKKRKSSSTKMPVELLKMELELRKKRKHKYPYQFSLIREKIVHRRRQSWGVNHKLIHEMHNEQKYPGETVHSKIRDIIQIANIYEKNKVNKLCIIGKQASSQISESTRKDNIFLDNLTRICILQSMELYRRMIEEDKFYKKKEIPEGRFSIPISHSHKIIDNADINYKIPNYKLCTQRVIQTKIEINQLECIIGNLITVQSEVIKESKKSLPLRIEYKSLITELSYCINFNKSLIFTYKKDAKEFEFLFAMSKNHLRILLEDKEMKMNQKQVILNTLNSKVMENPLSILNKEESGKPTINFIPIDSKIYSHLCGNHVSDSNLQIYKTPNMKISMSDKNLLVYTSHIPKSRKSAVCASTLKFTEGKRIAGFTSFVQSKNNNTDSLSTISNDLKESIKIELNSSFIQLPKTKKKKVIISKHEHNELRKNENEENYINRNKSMENYENKKGIEREKTIQNQNMNNNINSRQSKQSDLNLNINSRINYTYISPKSMSPNLSVDPSNNLEEMDKSCKMSKLKEELEELNKEREIHKRMLRDLKERENRNNIKLQAKNIERINKQKPPLYRGREKNNQHLLLPIIKPKFAVVSENSSALYNSYNSCRYQTPRDDKRSKSATSNTMKIYLSSPEKKDELESKIKGITNYLLTESTKDFVDYDDCTIQQKPPNISKCSHQRGHKDNIAKVYLPQCNYYKSEGEKEEFIEEKKEITVIQELIVISKDDKDNQQKKINNNNESISRKKRISGDCRLYNNIKKRKSAGRSQSPIEEWFARECAGRSEWSSSGEESCNISVSNINSGNSNNCSLPLMRNMKNGPRNHSNRPLNNLRNKHIKNNEYKLHNKYGVRDGEELKFPVGREIIPLHFVEIGGKRVIKWGRVTHGEVYEVGVEGQGGESIDKRLNNRKLMSTAHSPLASLAHTPLTKTPSIQHKITTRKTLLRNRALQTSLFLLHTYDST